MDNYNYPVGADNEDAPWNQPEPELEDKSVEVESVLYGEFDIKTDNYDIEEDWYEQHLSPYHLIQHYADLINMVLDNNYVSNAKRIMLEFDYKECLSWKQDSDISISE